jgi:hypothetical protein
MNNSYSDKILIMFLLENIFYHSIIRCKNPEKRAIEKRREKNQLDKCQTYEVHANGRSKPLPL